MRTESQSAATEELWNQMSPLLDEALAALGETDRQAVLLRFFENKTLAEVGEFLGMGEDTVRKRVSRALEKLHRYFNRCGVSSTTAIIAGAISTNSIQAAPIGLAKTISTVAVAKGAAASTSTLAFIKGALKIMTWSKAKTTIVMGAVVLFAAGTTTVAVKEIQEHRTYPWQVVNGNSNEGLKALNSTPPQVMIVCSKYETDKGHGSLLDDVSPKNQWRYIGIHSTPNEIIERTYYDGTFLLPSQIIFPTDMPNGFYDYVANLPNGSQQALQTLIRKKFGLIGKYEMRDIDVLLLKTNRSDISNLKQGQANQPEANASITHEVIRFEDLRIPKLATYLEQDLQIPIFDQTRLAGNYNFDFPALGAVQSSENPQRIKQSLFDQLDLELVSTNMPIEMLVVEKVKWVISLASDYALIFLAFVVVITLPVEAMAAVSASVVAVSPESPVKLLSRESFYAKVVYDSDQPLLIQARGWLNGHEVEAVMFNASQTYPAGHGEALVWLAYNPGGKIDEIRALVCNTNWNPITEATAKVQAQWIAAAAPAAEAPWVRQLSDEQQRMVSQQIQNWTNGPWEWLWDIVVLAMMWSVPGYPVLQLIALWRLRGWSRLFSLLPLIFILPTYIFCLDALSHQSNLWPLWAIFLSPLAFLYELILLLVFRRKKIAPPTLPQIG